MRDETDACLVTAQQTLQAAREAGLAQEQMALSGIAVLTFSRMVVDRLAELCSLEDVHWISSSRHPYAAARVIKRGAFHGLEVTVVVPPMGASPIACVIEDLIACGVNGVFLVCAAWSLGSPVSMGDLIVPAFSVGEDGTSIHYGNRSGHVAADPVAVGALSAACVDRGAAVRVGGNGCCEALYRITPKMAEGFRQRGCLCMDNGEASTLYAVTQAVGALGGVLFQPYIDLQRGWDPLILHDQRYADTCRIQAEVVLHAGTTLQQLGLLSVSG